MGLHVNFGVRSVSHGNWGLFIKGGDAMIPTPHWQAMPWTSEWGGGWNWVLGAAVWDGGQVDPTETDKELQVCFLALDLHQVPRGDMWRMLTMSTVILICTLTLLLFSQTGLVPSILFLWFFTRRYLRLVTNFWALLPCFWSPVFDWVLTRGWVIWGVLLRN